MDALQRLVDAAAKRQGPGAILMVEAPAIDFAWTGASGRFARSRTPALEPHHAFRIDGVTKAVTAATALRLVEAGRLVLDEPILRYLPTALGKRLREAPGATELTLRQLLSHRSGLGDYFDPTFRWIATSPALPSLARWPVRLYAGLLGRRYRGAKHVWEGEELVGYSLAHCAPSFPPGKGFQYSNTGYALAGLMIETAAGRPLHAAYRELVFDPLGMESTYLEGHEPSRGKLSHPFLGWLDASPANPTVGWAGGGLVSTAADLHRFFRGLLRQKLFASAILLKEMLLTQPVGDSAFPGLKSYGLGLAVQEFAGVELHGHCGDWGAFAYSWIGKNVVIAGTVNRYGPFAAPSQELVEGTVKVLKRIFRAGSTDTAWGSRGSSRTT